MDKETRAAAMARLRAALGNAQGLSGLAYAYGSAERLFDCYLRCGGVRFDAAKAEKRVLSTLQFRREQGLEDHDLDVHSKFEEHPVRQHFSTAFAPTAPDGCVVQYTRLAGLRPRFLMDSFSADDLRRFMALWLETSLRMQGDSTRARQEPCLGVYDVYDAQDFKFSTLLRDTSATRALARLLSMGEEHFPENLHKCFVINAPAIAGLVWKLLKPALTAETGRKVQISSSVPKELQQALGGDEGVKAMLASLPPSTPDP